MADYRSLALRFTKFRKNIDAYYQKLLKDYGNSGIAAIHKLVIDPNPKIINDMRASLTQQYGALAPHIYGMARYVSQSYGGRDTNIFLLAFRYIESGHYDSILWGLQSSLACLDVAIGGCHYAIANEVEIKGNQIHIHKGAGVHGLDAIINIFRTAKKSICVMDRYADRQLILILAALPHNISARIIIMSEKYHEKDDLKLWVFLKASG